MRRACCDTLEEHGIDSHLDSCKHSPPKRYTQADLDRAVEAEREAIVTEFKAFADKLREPPTDCGQRHCAEGIDWAVQVVLSRASKK